MAKRKQKTVPAKSGELSRFDEANVGRLGFISIQERIPRDFTSWAVDFTANGLPAKLECVAPSEYGGVPHGLDGDVATAVTQLFIDQGEPDSGEVRTTAYRIMQMAGLHATGRNYEALRASLNRLGAARYTASNAFYVAEKRRWETRQFNYFETVQYTSEDDDRGLSSKSVIVIRLAQPVAQSIRARYVKPLDYDFLISLKGPVSRNVYRLLDAKRYPSPEVHEPLPEYTANLLEWADLCKIVDKRSDKIRRTLESVHEELRGRGYLREVRYDGRGKSQRITYLFGSAVNSGAPQAPEQTGPEQAGLEQVEPEQSLELDRRPAVEALTRRGVARPQAARLVNQFGEARVSERVAKFEALTLAYAPKKPAAMLVDVIKDDTGKYADPEGYVGPEHRERAARLAEERARAEAEAEVRRTAEAKARPPEARAEEALLSLKGAFGKAWTEHKIAQLRAALLSGREDPQAFVNRIFELTFVNQNRRAALEEIERLIATP